MVELRVTPAMRASSSHHPIPKPEMLSERIIYSQAGAYLDYFIGQKVTYSSSEFFNFSQNTCRVYVCHRSHSSSDEGEQYAALIEYRTSDNPESMVIGSTSMSTPNTNSTSASTALTPALTAAPTARIRQVRPQLTLREQQVMQLRKEISHPAGVRFKLGRRDCKDGIAFVDCFGAVWLAH